MSGFRLRDRLVSRYYLYCPYHRKEGWSVIPNMIRNILRTIELLLIFGGLGLVLYAGYTYLGTDIEYAIGQLMPHSSLAAPAEAVASPARLPYPRGTGKPGVRLVIPRMQLDTAIKEAGWTTANQKGRLYSDWNLPYDAAGHLINTAQPGEAGNMVISGHNNLVGPNQFGVGLFAGLWNVKPGDMFYVIDAQGRAFEYQVTKSYPLKEEGQPAAVRAQHAQQILADNGQPVATLITCWNGPVAPLSGNTYRWIVDAMLTGQVDVNSVSAQ